MSSVVLTVRSPATATPSPPRRLACTCSTTLACRSAGPTSSARSASTVGDLVGKSEEDLLRIDGIGAKAIEELRDGLEAHDLLYILENNDDVADEEDLSQLLQMVFSPDGPDDILLGTSAPTHHADDEEELLGAPIDDKKAPANGAINEDMASLDELLNQLVDTDDAEEAKDNDEE